jgi:hypothetical protein
MKKFIFIEYLFLSMKKKVTIDVLMEGPAGNLVFQPVEFETRTALKRFAREAKNPVIKYNIEKAAKERRVEI